MVSLRHLHSHFVCMPFLLLQQSNGKTVLHEAPGHLLGAMPSMLFEEHRLQVAPGDMLFVYTDGLTDRRNAAGEFYSLDRIVALMDDARDADLTTVYDRIFEDVSTFAATDEFRDDIAFIVTRFH